MILTININLFQQQQPAGVHIGGTFFLCKVGSKLISNLNKLQIFASNEERQLVISGCRWEDNIEMNLKE
jgi:hypothetical protein